MLRITVHDTDTTQTIQLEGSVTGLWVDEFDRVWHDLSRSLGSAKLSIDLRDVHFIDERGTRILQDIYRQTKASFLSNSPLTDYFAAAATRSFSQNARQGHKGD